MPRTIAVGDIHGCYTAFDRLLDAVDLQSDDTLVTLGDYIDRGPDTRGVIERLIDLQNRYRLVSLMGNHDQMLLDALADPAYVASWLQSGGKAAPASYGATDPAEIPEEHFDFLRSCLDWHETETHLFVHASYYPEAPMAEQSHLMLRWESIRYDPPGPHRSGKSAVVGHTAQKSGRVLDLGYLKCIDTYCYGGGWLTALEVQTGQIWQANQAGKVRK